MTRVLKGLQQLDAWLVVALCLPDSQPVSMNVPQNKRYRVGERS
jgi:hypothetical protein